MRFSAFASGDCVSVASRWQEAFTQSLASTPARSLYTSVGWNYALRADNLLGEQCELWVVSAGFGLVRGDEHLPSYAATFAFQKNRVADQICDFRSSTPAHAAWWKAINAQRGRTETPLQTTFAGYDRVVVALSAPYLVAVRSDLELLARALGPQKLWLVAVGAHALPLSPELKECLVPLTSEVERLVSNPRATLNLRALVWWLEEVVPVAGWHREAQGQEIRRRLCEAKPKAVRVARALSDGEVTQWIGKQRRRAGAESPGKTQLLRTLRATGMACEQNRFSRLYDQVVTPKSV
jgi:hypothetical protein